VLEQLEALLLMYPRGRQFAADFPWVPEIVGKRFEEGVTPASAALQIAADIIVHLLVQLAEVDRRMARDNILATDERHAEMLAKSRLARETRRQPDPARFAAELCAVAIFMARRMTEQGTLRREEYRHLLKTIGLVLGKDEALLEALQDCEQLEQ
jgi:hypothetical protein